MYGDKDKNPIIDTGNLDYKNLCIPQFSELNG